MIKGSVRDKLARYIVR